MPSKALPVKIEVCTPSNMDWQWADRTAVAATLRVVALLRSSVTPNLILITDNPQAQVALGLPAGERDIIAANDSYRMAISMSALTHLVERSEKLKGYLPATFAFYVGQETARLILERGGTDSNLEPKQVVAGAATAASAFVLTPTSQDSQQPDARGSAFNAALRLLADVRAQGGPHALWRGGMRGIVADLARNARFSTVPGRIGGTNGLSIRPAEIHALLDYVCGTAGWPFGH